ncbi:MAG: septal ring lytic transglycosylase RlpA family protein [Leptolyngbya sp. SIO1E4]|nr:septal ring lytic transglycosylase RlpA family protein [Leptolyngbya sp. SIO1E4]
MMRLLSNIETIKLFTSLAWISKRLDFSFVERKTLIHVCVYEIGDSEFAADYEIGLSKSEYNTQVNQIFSKLDKFSYTDLGFKYNMDNSKEENIIEFITPFRLIFEAMLSPSHKNGDGAFTLDDFHRYNLFRCKLTRSDQPENSVEADLKLTRYRFRSIKLYESFLHLLDNGFSLIESTRKLARYLLRFTEDDAEASALISLTFWDGLPRLLRRIAANSNNTYQEIEEALLGEIKFSLLSLVDKHSLDDKNIYPLHCFVERYTRFLITPPFYTPDEIIAQAAARVTENRDSNRPYNLSAATRLECYLIISQLSGVNHKSKTYNKFDLKKIENDIAETLEKEIKQLALPCDGTDNHGPQHIDIMKIEHVDIMMSAFNRVREYLHLAIKLNLEGEDKARFEDILESSIQNQTLSDWIERIDCLLTDSLNKIPPKDAHKNNSKHNGRTLYSSHHYAIIACFALSISFGYLYGSHLASEKLRPIDGGVNINTVATPDNQNTIISPAAFHSDKNSVVQTGIATWSGSEYQNKETASGQLFDKNRLTASHPSLPFKSKVKITNLENQKDVTVEIIDRMTGSGEEIINLTESAANAIDMRTEGKEMVRLEVITFSDIEESFSDK